MTKAEQAKSEFVKTCTEIARQAEILKVAAENMFDYPADFINWGHVGDVKNTNQQLTELMEFIGLTK